MDKEWKGQINLAYSDIRKNYWINYINIKYEERFNVDMPFYGMARLFAKIMSWKYNVPINNESQKSKEFWDRYNTDESFRINHLTKKGFNKNEATELIKKAGDV